MSKLSSPVLALGAYAVVVAFLALNLAGGAFSSVAGAHPLCAANEHVIEGVCVAEAETPSRQPLTPKCHDLATGALKGETLFGDVDASHVYTSYRLAGADERDVVLPGGTWLADEAIRGGRFWVFADCTDLEIAKKVAVHRLAVNHDDPGAHDGRGDARLFRYITGTTLGPLNVRQLD